MAYYWSRRRAKRDGLPFRLTVTIIASLWPRRGRCPALGYILCPSKTRASVNSPSLDRRVPDRGYVPGNVCIISQRANEIKGNATARELRRVHRWLIKKRSK